MSALLGPLAPARPQASITHDQHEHLQAHRNLGPSAQPPARRSYAHAACRTVSEGHNHPAKAEETTTVQRQDNRWEASAQLTAMEPSPTVQQVAPEVPADPLQRLPPQHPLQPHQDGAGRNTTEHHLPPPPAQHAGMSAAEPPLPQPQAAEAQLRQLQHGPWIATTHSVVQWPAAGNCGTTPDWNARWDPSRLESPPPTQPVHTSAAGRSVPPSSCHFISTGMSGSGPGSWVECPECDKELSPAGDGGGASAAGDDPMDTRDH